MSPSIQLLKDRYLKNIKENPDLYIGIELEFPIVHTKVSLQIIEVSKDLMRFWLMLSVWKLKGRPRWKSDSACRTGESRSDSV